DVAIDALALDGVRIADHGGFGYLVMGHQRRFHLRRAHAVARHVDDVVDPAGDPVIAVGVAPAAVAGEVAARIGGEIGVDEALMVAEHRAHHARPRLPDAQIAAALALDGVTVLVDDLGHDAK